MNEHEASPWQAPSRARARPGVSGVTSRSRSGSSGSLGRSALLGLLLGGLAACGGEGKGEQARPGPSSAAESTAEAPAEPGSEATRWRFVPTLEQHLPAGAVGVPVLELSRPRQRTVTIVAAVLRAKAEHVELERWTFTPSPDGQSLQLVTGGEAVMRLRPGPRSAALSDLRREVAAPNVVLTRPVGLAAADARGSIAVLSTAFATLRDAKAEPRARVEAAATVTRGLDDTVIFDHDAIWEVAALLDPAPATIEMEALSERRARATLAHAGGTARLELQRKSEGWAVVAIERPKPATPPPASDTSATGSTG